MVPTVLHEKIMLPDVVTLIFRGSPIIVSGVVHIHVKALLVKWSLGAVRIHVVPHIDAVHIYVIIENDSPIIIAIN